MKGAQSATDEAKLSFHIATISSAGLMMVREYLWNIGKWGAAATVRLSATKT